ncbi:MAG: sulfatase [Acidobacteria bacterium]|nr:sulfatase [Acidobacteriota bacterium]
MTRRNLFRMAAGGMLPAVGAAQGAGKPNVIVIVTDDHGYADVSCYDHPAEVKTPNIDRIAARGVRFTQGYASAYVCAPTRAGIMTGRYQQRYGFYTAADSRVGLPKTEITLADLMKKAGYRTGAFGKWHLGIEPAYHPLRRGFDEFYGFLGHGAHDYFNLNRDEDYPHQSIWRNDKVIDDRGYLTDNLGREAVGFIGRNAGGPFFLYLAFNAVHVPMQAPEDVVRKYDTGKKNRDIYLAMLEREDAAVGQVLDELEKRGLEKNTLIFFLSDNGGARANSANNGKLRDFKQSVYEGGIRVPFLLSWPARLPQDKVVEEPVICFDILPTVCAATGVAVPQDRPIDGVNLLPLLDGKAKGPVHEALFWDGYEGKRAVRTGRWKLVDNNGKLELFDLGLDSGEKTNLAAKEPERLAELKKRFEAWRTPMPPRIGKGGGE